MLDSAVSVVSWKDLHMLRKSLQTAVSKPNPVHLDVAQFAYFQLRFIPATQGFPTPFGEMFSLLNVLERLSQHPASTKSWRD